VSKIEEEESKNELAADLSASLKAMIPGLAPVDASASVGGGLKTGRVSSEKTGQNKALHHYYYALLERWLENFKGDWFHDFADITEDIEGRSWVEDCWSILSSSWKSQRARVTRLRHPTNHDADRDVRLGASGREPAGAGSLA
jgi:hypothetical protein